MGDTNHTSVKHLVDSQNFSFGSAERIENKTRQMSEVEIQEKASSEPKLEDAKIVEVGRDKIELSQELIDMGVESINENEFPSVDEINLPLTDEKVESGRSAPITSSIKWLSELCIYILKQAHVGLKKFHGKIVRVNIK